MYKIIKLSVRCNSNEAVEKLMEDEINKLNCRVISCNFNYELKQVVESNTSIYNIRILEALLLVEC